MTSDTNWNRSTDNGALPSLPSRLEGGRRIAAKNDPRGPNRPTPLVTVVTVVFNGAKALEATIKSVLAAAPECFEFIVIDGKSVDGTVDVLKAYDGEISYWVSEPDNGIYDAFNKAVRVAHGEWILFLGAGDLLFSRQHTERLVQQLKGAPFDLQVAYGRVLTHSVTDVFVEEENGPWEDLKDKWQGGRKFMPHHQGIFQRRKSLLDRPFDEKYKIVADYKAFMQATTSKPPMYADAVITKVFVGGVSTTPLKSLAAVLEIMKLNRELGLGLDHLPHQIFFFAKSIVKTLLAMSLPGRTSTQIIDAYRLATRRRKKWT
jgi:hypothetical protein